ncbi:alpha/beta hydrolase [Sphaerisporangium sp. NPDC051011]|uniref:alpha/beta fold hydrolase n=1 Tax=Sphaerisporangium sp. NPDC051011 TaxID=3155792 RepID=UPI0033CAF9F6
MTTSRPHLGYVDVLGARVAYIDSTPAAPSALPPIVLLHGSGGSAASHFAFLMPMLASQRRVVGIDFAISPDRGKVSLSELVSQVDAVVRTALPHTPATICGYSLGAVVAAAFAAEHANAVTELALICGWAKTDHQQRVRNDIWKALRNEGSTVLAEFSAYCAYGGPYLAARTPTEIANLIAAVSVTDSMDAHMELSRSIDIEHLLGDISAPALVIGAAHDQMVPVRHSKLLWGAIADARYAEVSAGHAVMVERPAQIFQLISTFSNDPGRVPAGGLLDMPMP